MRVAWDEAKNVANLQKHGISFQEAAELLTAGGDYLEIFDEAHSYAEDRFIAIGPIARGLILVAWAARDDETIRIISARWANTHEQGSLSLRHGWTTMTEIPALTDDQFARALPATLRKRLMLGQFSSG